MLSHLHISNFTLVDQLELELEHGLSALTGETGAGKSILLDALSLVLGDRADADKVRHGAERADIQANFALAQLPFVRKWLLEHELSNGDECILRRVVTQEGRSRGFINGQAVTLQQLKTLGNMLVDIHGQHEHQSLLKTSTHVRMLDEFGKQRKLAKEVKRAFFHWHTTKTQLDNLQNQSDEINARYQLLSYQVEELNVLALADDEVSQLERKQKQLANLEHSRQCCQQVLAICTDDEHGLINQINGAARVLSEINDKSDNLDGISGLFEQALINIQEAQSDLEREQDDTSLDPSELPQIEERLSLIYDIARKHRVQPDALFALHQQLSEELNQLQSGDEQINTLEQALQQHQDDYTGHAKKLSSARQKSAKKLCKLVNEKLKLLAMEHASFHIDMQATTDEPNAQGNENVHFLISTSPGQAAKPLAKIASGGELSRISLAIQVITAQTSTIPTLVLDEVDVGIGGTTGDVVGSLLRELGEQGQILCVTHLAQVASKAHNHLCVEKTIRNKSVNSSLKTLSSHEKVIEIARMMGGSIESQQSLAHAKEMLDTTHKARPCQ